MCKKDGMTNNIYSSWFETIKKTGTGAALKPIRGLDTFSKTELQHLIWLLHEELKQRPKSIKEN